MMKMTALAAVAAAALMVFAVTALATTLTAPANTVVKKGTTFNFTIPAGSRELMDNTRGEEIDTCPEAIMRGKTTNEGGTGVAVTGNVETLDWINCSFATMTLRTGGLQVNGTGSGNVSATSTFEWTINTGLFGSCIYGVTTGTSIGTLANGSLATFTANAVLEKFPGGTFACPETAKWTGTYIATEPKELSVDE